MGQSPKYTRDDAAKNVARGIAGWMVKDRLTLEYLRELRSFLFIINSDIEYEIEIMEIAERTIIKADD